MLHSISRQWLQRNTRSGCHARPASDARCNAVSTLAHLRPPLHVGYHQSAVTRNLLSGPCRTAVLKVQPSAPLQARAASRDHAAPAALQVSLRPETTRRPVLGAFTEGNRQVRSLPCMQVRGSEVVQQPQRHERWLTRMHGAHAWWRCAGRGWGDGRGASSARLLQEALYDACMRCRWCCTIRQDCTGRGTLRHAARSCAWVRRGSTCRSATRSRCWWMVRSSCAQSARPHAAPTRLPPAPHTPPHARTLPPGATRTRCGPHCACMMHMQASFAVRPRTCMSHATGRAQVLELAEILGSPHGPPGFARQWQRKPVVLLVNKADRVMERPREVRRP
jgi:hypothetical protein